MIKHRDKKIKEVPTGWHYYCNLKIEDLSGSRRHSKGSESGGADRISLTMDHAKYYGVQTYGSFDVLRGQSE